MTPSTAPVSPVNSTQTSGAPGAGSEQSSLAGPFDFLLMLGQLIGAAPQPTTTASAPPQSAVAPESGEETAIAPIVALPIAPSMAPDDVAVRSDGGATDDLVLELKLARQPMRADLMRSFEWQGLQQTSGDAAAVQNGDSSFEAALASAPGPSEAQGGLRAQVNEAALARPMQAPVGSGAWADELGSRLTMMVEQGRQTASLRLSPEQLGPLEIRISIQDDQASVWFGAAHADTRAAIEQALPRLRELFEAQGMSLEDAGVFREPPREQAGAGYRAESAAEPSSSGEPSHAPTRWGLIDAYA